MKRRSMILLGLFVALAIVLSGFGTVFAGETYKLGLSLAITGPTSDAGNPYAKGVEDYFRYVNETKMLGDDKIDCTIRDDQYKTDVTKRNFEDFLAEDIVFYLNYSTGSTMAMPVPGSLKRPASFMAERTGSTMLSFTRKRTSSVRMSRLSPKNVFASPAPVPEAGMMVAPVAPAFLAELTTLSVRCGFTIARMHLLAILIFLLCPYCGKQTFF